MNNIELRKFEQAYAQFERLLKLRGYSDATQDSYLRSLRRFAHWAGKCPGKRMSKLLLQQFWRSHRNATWIFPSRDPERYSTPRHDRRAAYPYSNARLSQLLCLILTLSFIKPNVKLLLRM